MTPFPFLTLLIVKSSLAVTPAHLRSSRVARLLEVSRGNASLAPDANASPTQASEFIAELEAAANASHLPSPDLPPHRVANASHLPSLQPVSSQYRQPRVYFLFLAVDKISNLEVWLDFFKSAPQDSYRVYAHCKLDSCKNQLFGTVFRTVPTVPSYYCSDLVSPMNQMLAWAMHDDKHETTPLTPNPNDKFAFISDSTLPAKPFDVLHRELVHNRRGSDFCVFPASEFADIAVRKGPSTISREIGREWAAKHHQWVTLQRDHAEKLSQLWASGTMHDFMSRFGMNQLQWGGSDNSHGDGRNFGCLDEYWHMAALYGTLSSTGPQDRRDVDLAGFTGSPLALAPEAGWQGKCDTFVMWSQFLASNMGDNPFQRLLESLDPASKPHSGTAARPGWWDSISVPGISAIRNSDFLFVRKFVDKPSIATGGDFAYAWKYLVLES